MEAKIVCAWKRDPNAYLAFSVDGTEYVASVLLADLEGLSASQAKAALISAAKDAFILAQPAKVEPMPVTGSIKL